MFDRGSKYIQWSQGSLSNKWCWENWAVTCRKMKLHHLLTPHTTINSKWIKDLNVRSKTIQIIEENIGSKISDIVHSNILLDIPLQKKISKWDYIKQKGVCTAKEIFNKIKRQPTECENIFTHTSDKGLTAKNP